MQPYGETESARWDLWDATFTRDVRGQKHYIDHRIHSVQDYLSPEFQRGYECMDVNVRQENMFTTKMRRRGFDLDSHMF